MFRELVYVGWDRGSRFRQRRLFVIVAICIFSLAGGYLYHWDNIHDPAETPRTQVDPDRGERLARCC